MYIFLQGADWRLATQGQVPSWLFLAIGDAVPALLASRATHPENFLDQPLFQPIKVAQASTKRSSRLDYLPSQYRLHRERAWTPSLMVRSS